MHGAGPTDTTNLLDALRGEVRGVRAYQLLTRLALNHTRAARELAETQQRVAQLEHELASARATLAWHGGDCCAR